MKKAISFVLLALTLCLTLTGCIHTDFGVSLNKDGTGTLVVAMGFEECFYAGLVEGGTDPLEGKETFTYDYGDDTYVGYRETREFENYDDLRQALLEMKYETDYLKTEANEEFVPESLPIFKNVEIKKDSGLFTSKYSFRAELNEQESVEEELYDFNELFKVTVSIEMPGKITEYKGGELQENKVVYEIQDLTGSNEIYAASQTSNTAAVVTVIAVAVIILAVGIIAAIKSKKN